MNTGFRFLENIALADMAFEAWGESPSELFSAAAEALITAMANPRTVGTGWKHEVDLAESNVSDLLFEWLSHLVFLKDAEAVVFHDVQANVWQDPDTQIWHVRGRIFGERVDATAQELRADVKAITKHLYEVDVEPGRYRAQVVLDV